ncbi:uncharacterized protein LOC142322712 [Lycorma delicatula]|uniref:uncharacterized protein LOC142322712 n=1 Tax=Lycorma delicatula TaxID=130591 RepID=UPI003F50FD30
MEEEIKASSDREDSLTAYQENVAARNEYSSREAPAHTKNVDAALNETVCIATGCLKPTPVHSVQTHDILSLKYTSDELGIITGSADGIIRYYGIGSLKMKKKVGKETTDLKTENVPVTCIETYPALHKSRQLWCLATYTDGSIKIWNLENEKLMGSIQQDSQLLGVFYHTHSNRFLTCRDDGIINMYDEETLTHFQSFRNSNIMGKNDGHTSRVFSISFHPKNANEFISGGWDNTVQFWDMRFDRSVRYLSGPHMCGDSLAIRPSGKEILSGSYTKTSPLQLYDYASGKLLLNFECDPFNHAMVYCVKWFNQDIFVTGCNEPSLFRVVTMDDGGSMAYYRTSGTAVYSLDCLSPAQIEQKHVKKSQSIDRGKDRSSLQKITTDFLDYDKSFIRGAFCNGRMLLEVEVSNLNYK